MSGEASWGFASCGENNDFQCEAEWKRPSSFYSHLTVKVLHSILEIASAKALHDSFSSRWALPFNWKFLTTISSCWTRNSQQAWPHAFAPEIEAGVWNQNSAVERLELVDPPHSVSWSMKIFFFRVIELSTDWGIMHQCFGFFKVGSKTESQPWMFGSGFSQTICPEEMLLDTSEGFHGQSRYRYLARGMRQKGWVIEKWSDLQRGTGIQYLLFKHHQEALGSNQLMLVQQSQAMQILKTFRLPFWKTSDISSLDKQNRVRQDRQWHTRYRACVERQSSAVIAIRAHAHFQSTSYGPKQVMDGRCDPTDHHKWTRYVAS